MSFSDMRWMNELKNSTEILTKLEFDLKARDAGAVHHMTGSLTQLAEKLKKKAGMEESIARFELDLSTDRIFLNLYDVETGEKRLQLTPEQVEAGLKELEETDDDETPLLSFFEESPEV